MSANGQDLTPELLKLRSRMSELAQVHGWIEGLAVRHSVPDNVQFAMDLCLEEVLSNIIKHGYSGQPDHPITVQFSRPRQDLFVFVVEDAAPPFNPLDMPELPASSPAKEIPVGGQGIRLLKRFADALEYHTTPAGNQLKIGFSAAHAVTAQD
jgi:serine/threonine-protein kinase RsbW